MTRVSVTLGKLSCIIKLFKLKTMERKMELKQKETTLIYICWKFVLESNTSGRKICHYHEKWQCILNSA